MEEPGAEPGGAEEPAPGDLLEVAVTLPLAETLTYRASGTPPAIGAQVVVPLGRRRVTGFVVGYPRAARGPVRAIDGVVDEAGCVDSRILDLCRWAASYYIASLGEVLRMAVPSGQRASASRRVAITPAGRAIADGAAGAAAALTTMRLDRDARALLARLARAGSLSLAGLTRVEPGNAAHLEVLVQEGLVEIKDRLRGHGRRRAQWPEGLAPTLVQTAPMAAPPVLNADQAVAVESLVSALDTGFRPFLLQGVTGSGKTEVYLRTIQEVRRRGRGALVLVPEIALTPQLAARFGGRFGDDVAVLHSALAPAARRQAWQRLRSGQVGIALGARSAVFAPLREVGIVVVDEEHDGSFKQEEGVHYHARDLAIVRAQQAGAVVVLGSATPSLETSFNAETGRYRRLLLPLRANPAAALRPLPPIEIVDLRVHAVGADGLLSPPLVDALGQTLAAGEQAILFLNRRGFSTVILCRACGQALRCPDCAVAMTYHRREHCLLCHYCAHTERRPETCPRCGSNAIEGVGIGTERVEAVVRELFPRARVARLDRDSTGGDVARMERVLDGLRDGAIDVLVGTQMVAKGHDFPRVTLVAVVLADQGMHLPDFRASERTFQLLEQVAGRAGRADHAGRVVVQTYSPEHPAIDALRTHDYGGFVAGELGRRRDAGYPPLTRMVALRIEGADEGRVRACAAELAARARSSGGRAVRVLGPSEAPIARLRGRARWQVWLVSADRAALSRAARDAGGAGVPAGVRVTLDVDPYSVL